MTEPDYHGHRQRLRERFLRWNYPTQKPETLLERFINASASAGDLGRCGMHVTSKRLLGIENCKPFEVLNLSSYEHTYEKAGKYRNLVKVIDIFGNHTSQAFDVEVK